MKDIYILSYKNETNSGLNVLFFQMLYFFTRVIKLTGCVVTAKPFVTKCSFSSEKNNLFLSLLSLFPPLACILAHRPSGTRGKLLLAPSRVLSYIFILDYFSCDCLSL